MKCYQENLLYGLNKTNARLYARSKEKLQLAEAAVSTTLLSKSVLVQPVSGDDSAQHQLGIRRAL